MANHKSPSFTPIEWKGSLLLLFAEIVANVLVALSPIAWMAHCRSKPVPMWGIDLWFLATCCASRMFLYWFNVVGDSISIGVALYLLLESLGVLLRDIVGSPAIHADSAGVFIGVREPRRWLILAPLSGFPVVLAFATLYLVYGSDFHKPIQEPLQAAYYSLVTFTTLGYGDHFPKTNTGRCIAMAELAFFVVFLTIKLPIAVSLIRGKAIVNLGEDTAKPALDAH